MKINTVTGRLVQLLRPAQCLELRSDIIVEFGAEREETIERKWTHAHAFRFQIDHIHDVIGECIAGIGCAIV
jgi:hypothetical protein